MTWSGVSVREEQSLGKEEGQEEEEADESDEEKTGKYRPQRAVAAAQSQRPLADAPADM